MDNTKIVSCDGGAFMSPPKFKFEKAYITIVDEITGDLIHHEREIGDFYSGLAEYLATEWAIKNIEKPLTIYSDCKTAIAWANKRGKFKKWKINPPSLENVILQHKSGNKADVWNAQNYSPKKDKSFYIKRYYENFKK